MQASRFFYSGGLLITPLFAAMAKPGLMYWIRLGRKGPLARLTRLKPMPHEEFFQPKQMRLDLWRGWRIELRPPL